MSMTEETIHHTWIPVSHALLLGIGLLLGLFGTIYLKGMSYSEQFLYLYNAFLVFGVFLIEVALTFMDMACVYSQKRIKGQVFWVLFRLFLIIPLVLALSAVYYKCPSNWLLLFIIVTISWLKWEIVHLGNNMEKFVISLERLNIVANRL